MSREIKFRAWQPHASLHRKPGMYFVDDLVFYERDEEGHEGEAFLTRKLGTSRSSEYLDDIHLMQYTGLKDKNGVEIYEGDIIEKIQYSRPFSKSKKSCRVRYLVKWDDQIHDDNDWNNDLLAKDPSVFSRRPGFIGEEIWNEKGYGHHNWSEFAQCEVIGNIYENPELLENKEK